MQSPNRKYVPELDQLRAFAALLVFFYHCLHTGRMSAGLAEWPKANMITAVVVEGHTGVALFMVLSGFVLARGAIGPAVNYTQFIKNRALRIMPLMIFVLVFAIYGNTGNTSLSAILAPFLLLANTSPRLFTDVTDISGTVWTISIEFQFYLIAPFLFAFVARRGIGYLVSLAAFAWIAKCIVLAPHAGIPADLYTIPYYTIVGRLNQFLIGVGLAYLWPEIAAWFRTRDIAGWVVLAFASVAIVTLSYVVNIGGGDRVWQPWMIVGREIEGIVWAGVIMGYVLARPLKDSALAAIFMNIGVISYSIYILHWPLEQIFWRTLAELGVVPNSPGLLILLLLSLILLPIVLAVSRLSYFVIERPFLEMRGRYVPHTNPSGVLTSEQKNFIAEGRIGIGGD